MARRIKVTSIPQDELDHERISIAIWLQSKRIQRERREREAKARAKREETRDER